MLPIRPWNRYYKRSSLSLVVCDGPVQTTYVEHLYYPIRPVRSSESLVCADLPLNLLHSRKNTNHARNSSTLYKRIQVADKSKLIQLSLLVIFLSTIKMRDHYIWNTQ